MISRTDFLAAIERRLEEMGEKAASVSRRAVGNPYLIRNIQRGGGWPSVDNLRALCQVLGFEFYVGPRRSRPSKTVIQRLNYSFPPAAGGPEAVRDKRLAALLAAICEHWEELGSEYAREDWLRAAYGTSHALGARRSALSRVVAWLGWRVIEGGREDSAGD